MFLSEAFGGVIPGAQGAVLGVLLRTGEPLTGRQIHRLIEDAHSLWSVQEALKALASLGLVETRTIGRAGVHCVNEDHSLTSLLRLMVSPIDVLERVIAEFDLGEVHSVILFGSVARGEPTRASDIDLAVIAPAGWGRGAGLQEHVHRRMGNACDVLTFTPEEFEELRASSEPVVVDIERDGLALIGGKPRPRGRVA